MAIVAPQPEVGSSGWGVALNQFFYELEQGLSGLLPIGPLTVLEGSTFPDYYTKDEVNEIIAGANFSFFLSDTVDAGIGAYFQLFDADPEGIKSQVGPVAIPADGTPIKTFITEIGQPTFKVLAEGVFTLDIHALTTVGANTKAAQLQWELWKRTHPGGVETKLVTSEESRDLTGGEIHYTIHAALGEEINLDDADRFVLKILGNNSGTQPNNPSVTIFMEGDTASRVSVQTTITAFDDRYYQLTGAKALLANLDMGGFAITNVGNVDGVDVSAHKARHENAGADEISVAGLSGELADLQPPKAHAMGSASHIASTIAELNSKVSDGPLDNTAGVRTPTNHNNNHWKDAEDEIILDKLGTPTDNVDLDSSIAQHGLLKKLSNDATEFMNGVGTWAVPPGGAGGAWTQIAETTVGAGGAASIDWVGIAADYTHLAIMGNVRSEAAGGQDRLALRFNNDGGANYEWQECLFQGDGNPAAIAVRGSTYGSLGQIDDNASEADSFSSLWVMIPNYANTNFNKMAQARTFLIRNNDNDLDLHTFWGSNHWDNAAAINRITILTDGGDDIAEHSKLTLWGIT